MEEEEKELKKYIKKLKDILNWEGNLIQKIFLLIFVINLFITPLICSGTKILGYHRYSNYIELNGVTYEEFYLWILIGLVSLFSIYLFKGK